VENVQSSEQGAESAAAEEFRSYRPALRGYFRRRVSEAAAEDLIQDVFLAMQRRKSGAQVLNLGGYLFVVASRVLQHYREREERNASSSFQLDTHDYASDEPSAERLLLDREDLRRAFDIINKLPRRTHDIFVLHRFEEMSYIAIANKFGVTVSAVEKHISTALGALAALRRRS
jgi:RNA polymerase sigma-70 factor (ECF subfamily)